ncbi:AAA-like domain-containing protein [Desulfobacterales bacterium HSG17]|nr:AAA-like domain-containing protein [Desulfobacterales bacterium HSG17]
MRKFSSYGPIDKDLHYYVPRKELIDTANNQLLGKTPDKKGGHYITVWAPRQAGKSWVMQQILWDLQKDERFHVLKLNLEHLKMTKDPDRIVRDIAGSIIRELGIQNVSVNVLDDFHTLFSNCNLDKPLVLIMDEFDALAEDAISGIVGVFRNIYNHRQDDPNPSFKKKYLLHSVALIGVRSVLGIENTKGSPFNVQRSLHIPNLDFEEVESMFKWYENESGQKVDQDVIDRIFYEAQGQPGITSWIGELLTETYNNEPDRPISMRRFDIAYAHATDILPNSNIINIISKAIQEEPCKNLILKLFRTERKLPFKYDNPIINFLYMNGVIDFETEDETNFFARFPCPFIQKRLFNFFAYELFDEMGRLREPFEDISDTITKDSLNIRKLMHRHEQHLIKNKNWMLKDAPRRKDMRIFEAVFHFNLFRYLCDFLDMKEAKVYPEFPTGNGRVDIIIEYAGQIYALEVKSFADQSKYAQALEQAAQYGKQLHLSEISLVFFIEYIDDKNREVFEKDYEDEETGVIVKPVFVETGE